MTDEQEVLMTAPEVARLLHVHVNTVKRISPAELPYFRVGHRGDRRYRLDDVTEYLRRMTEDYR